jgi:hypothetical protein
MTTPISPDTPALPFPATKRARGRSLADFGELLPAEQKLLACSAKGECAGFGAGVPADASNPNTIVRADFLRFLVLGGDEQAPVHEQGVQLVGAWIEGKLDLGNCVVPHGITLLMCKFKAAFIVNHAHITGLISLDGSHLLQGLEADGLRCDSGVFLRYGFHSSGEVRLLRAHIGTNLDCAGGQFQSKGGIAIAADGVVVQGSVRLAKDSKARDFKAKGEVRFVGAYIGGELDCSGGQFEREEGDALIADGVVVKGHVFLRKGFKVDGQVTLMGAQIGGSLDCRGGNFMLQTAAALKLKTAIIQGGFYLVSVVDPVIVDATSAQIGVLEDTPDAWAKDATLNGLVYRSLGGNASTDAATRIKWLKLQCDEDLGEDKLKRNFRPQPWKQLQKVLREMGHDADARAVGVAYENQLRKADRIGQITDFKNVNRWIPFLRRKCLRALHWLFGFLAGYGYHPLRLFMSLVGVWLFCGVIYWWLAYAPHSAIGPTDPLVFQNTAYSACAKENNGNWMLCRQLPAEYTTFSPLAYSLDVLLPLVDLRQEKRWGPLVPTPASHFCIELLSLSPPHWVRLLNWFQILYGWIASLLFVAIVSGMSRRSEMDK